MGLGRLIHWLETHWVAPAYSGGVLAGLTIFFFGAATNTMAGWLYVISGVNLALLMLGAWLPPRNLRGLQLQRQPIRPVSAGESLQVEVWVENNTPRPKSPLEIRDRLPAALGKTPQATIAAIGPQTHYRWHYDLPTQRRGLYHWQAVDLRTAAPLGLFWCRRRQQATAHVTVYPRILSLSQCPLIDEMSLTAGVRWQRSRSSDHAAEGLTRALRPYRWGDPTRLIHWRTSARYGELRVRELERFTADNQVLLALDTQDGWAAEDFEAAVTTAATLYRYALRKQLSVALWMAHTGILQDKHTVLSALAVVMPPSRAARTRLPAQPLIWLGTARTLPMQLPEGSAWIKWSDPGTHHPAPSLGSFSSVLAIRSGENLATQLQALPVGLV